MGKFLERLFGGSKGKYAKEEEQRDKDKVAGELKNPMVAPLAKVREALIQQNPRMQESADYRPEIYENKWLGENAGLILCWRQDLTSAGGARVLSAIKIERGKVSYSLPGQGPAGDNLWGDLDPAGLGSLEQQAMAAKEKAQPNPGLRVSTPWIKIA